MERIVELRNNTPQKDFSGLSPNQMYQLLYSEENQSIIVINESDDAYKEIPIIRLIDSLRKKN